MPQHFRQPVSIENDADRRWLVRDANNKLVLESRERELAEELTDLLNVGWEPISLKPLERLVIASAHLRSTEKAAAPETFELILDMEVQIRSMMQRIYAIANASHLTPIGWARDLAEEELRSAPSRMIGTYPDA